MVSERKTDDIVRELLKDAGINYDEKISSNPEIDKALNNATKSIESGSGENKGFPEFVAQVGEFVIVIEDKRESSKQVLYSKDDPDKLEMSTEPAIKNYAENGALHYAQHIVNNSSYKKIFAFGCSGTDPITIRPIFVDENDYKLLNEVEDFENFNEDNIERYYLEKICHQTPPEIIEMDEVLKRAKELHEHLRNYGQLRETENPLVVSAILLALNEDKDIINKLKGKDKVGTGTDGEELYDTIKKHLNRIEVQPETKKEVILNEFNLLKTRKNLYTIDERLKDKSPLKCFTEYIDKYIFHSAKENSQQDVLAKFYGQFIKYSGGDGQSLGIVLTPNHITELFCDLINLQPDDIVFDPCCGTGSFLLTAMNRMINLADNDAQIGNIKKEQIHGVETREDMFSIATTNMILRGDGKSNLIRNDFFKLNEKDLNKKNFTVGFMNPPYSQAKNRETWHLSEISFTERLLNSLSKNARAVVIVPLSTMIGKSNYDKEIKKRILKKHTLEGTIILNPDTFYKIGAEPCIAIFKCHIPHPKDKYVKFINYKDDGFEIGKHLGLIETERAEERKKLLLDCWLHNKPVGEDFMIQRQIKDTDEWLHSFYYFNDNLPNEKSFDDAIGSYLSFEFGMLMKGNEYLFNE